MSLYTPWTSSRIGETGFAGGWDVYSVRDSRDTEIASGLTKDAAELIAAAPELLEALKWCAEHSYAGGKSFGDVPIVKNAIAKAKP